MGNILKIQVEIQAPFEPVKIIKLSVVKKIIEHFWSTHTGIGYGLGLEEVRSQLKRSYAKAT